MRFHSVFFIIAMALLVTLGCNSLSDVNGSRATIAISNKITSLPVGQSYVFSIDEGHDHPVFSTRLDGAGALLVTGDDLTYIAPGSVPSVTSVTVTVSESGVSDSDTFSITGASNPVVSVSPPEFSVPIGSAPITLHITVTQDSADDVLTIGMADCTDGCGSFEAISGAPGSGTYTVQYDPPASQPASNPHRIDVTSTLAGVTHGVAFVTIVSPSPWDY